MESVAGREDNACKPHSVPGVGPTLRQFRSGIEIRKRLLDRVTDLTIAQRLILGMIAMVSAVQAQAMGESHRQAFRANRRHPAIAERARHNPWWIEALQQQREQRSPEQLSPWPAKPIFTFQRH